MARAGDRTFGTGSSIVTNAGSSLLVKLTTSAFTAVLTVFLARRLGPSEYGLFALAVSVGALLLLPSDFGVSASAARFLAERRGDRAAAAAVVRDALTIKLVGGVAVSGVMAAAAGAIAAAYGEPDLTWPLRGIALALLGQNLMALFFSAFGALRRVPLQLPVMFAESAVETGASIALVLTGAGAAGAAFGRAAGYLVGGLAGAVIAARIFGRGMAPSVRLGGRGQREIVRYAGSLFLIDAAFTLFGQIDILFIGAYLSAAAVGTFQAPLRLVSFLGYFGQALASAIAPRMVRTGDEPPQVGALEQALRLLLVLHAGLAVAVLAWAQPIADLVLGTGYEGAAAVLRSLAPFILLIGVGPLVSTSVNFAGRARARVPIAVGTLLVNVILDIVLIPRIGIIGGGIATSAAYLVYVPAHLLLCRKLFGLRLAPLAATLARVAPAAAALGGVLAAVGVRQLSAAEWLLGGVAGTIAFAGVAYATGAIRRTDVDAVRHATRRLGRSR